MRQIHDSAQHVYLPFGKYKNESVATVFHTDPKYLRWLYDNTTLQTWKDIIAKTVKGESVAAYASLPTPSKSDSGVRTASLVLTETGRIAVKFAYNKNDRADVRFKDELKLAVEGLRWEGSPHFRWTVGSESLPKLVRAFGGTQNIFASQDVKNLYAAESSRRKTLNKIRAKEDSDIEINTLLPLRNYQKVAVEFVEYAGGRALIADSPGVGKTCTAIGYAVRNNLRTLVICPKAVVINWEREILRFAGKHACVWTSKNSGDADADYHIINYDIVEKRLDDLLAQKFDLLVCDEATAIKNHKSKRSKAILGSWTERSVYPGIKTPHLILLTGTPILNKPIEAFQLLKFINKDRFGNVMAFMDKYGRPNEPARNHKDLHERTKDLMIRRHKRDIQKEMPSKTRDEIVVELPPAAMKQYNELLDDIFRQWNVMGKPSAAQMPAIQQFLLPFKQERAYEFIDELVESGESVLVFSQFRQPIYDLKKRYGESCGIIMGGMNTTERQKTIDGLRDKKLKVGAATITSAGMGIDGIQYGVSTVIFLDYYWTPSIHEQAEDRVHRSGQTESVQVYYLMCKDTVDEDMSELLKEKQRMIDRIIDGTLVTAASNKSFFKDFITRIKVKRVSTVDIPDATEGDEHEVMEE